MTALRRVRRLGLACVTLALAACASAERVAAPPPALPPVIHGPPTRVWTFGTFPTNRTAVVNGPRREQTEGVVHDVLDFGSVFGAPPPDFRSKSEVFSSADGTTYWVSTDGDSRQVQLTQVQAFRKLARDASLRFVVTQAQLRGGIFNNLPVSRDCREQFVNCATEVASVSLVIAAWRDTGSVRQFLYLSSDAFLTRNANRWFFDPTGSENYGGSRFLWSSGDFVQNFTDGRDARLPTVSLLQPNVVRVDLSEVDVGESFSLSIFATAATYNPVNNEDYVHAYLRDPAGADGTRVEYTGLQPVPTASPQPPLGTFGEAPPCAAPGGGAGGSAGTLQFSRAAYRQDELPVPGIERVRVTRTGGSSGRVSATVTTSDGTARAGSDYTAVVGTVAFADGDTAARTVRVPFVLDTVAEPDKALTLRLSNPRGCATLGTSTATLTITDDDRPPLETAFAVGGTVSGLAGSGLVLENALGGETLPVSANGAFTFTRPSVTGLEYDVRVATQPSGPAQVCTVANGRGTMAEAPVTDVAVTCVTPTPVSGLDPAFGTGGRVATPLNGGRGEAVAVQPDGKIVVAGRSVGSAGASAPSTVDFTVLRYLPNGAPDAGFGTAGVATVNFPAGRTDEALDLALQADGRIVVAGSTQTAGGELDFGVARFNADGTVDRSFGTNGTVTTDFGPGSASAQGVAVQPDGRIVVAGHAAVGPPNNDFALARYNADGTPDASFGTAGRVTTHLTGRADLGMAVALAPDGKIVVAGRAEQGGARGDDFAVARYTAAGALDLSFGGSGFVTTDFAGGSEQANDVAVLADGRIVAAGYSGARGTGSFDYALARYTSDGRPDASFGGALGTVTTDLSGSDDFGEGLAVSGDGRLVVVGRRTGTGFFDLALTRYLPNGALDAAFGTAGRVEVDAFGAADEGQAVAVQPDGRVVAAGVTRNGGAPHVLLVRVVP